MRLGSLFLAVLALAARVTSAPPHQVEVRRSDPAFSVSESTLAASVECPNGTEAEGGIVFLIHGIGSTGRESWSFGPYNVLLPKAGPGYSVCWLNFPNRGQGDLQINAEYVAYNIKALAKKSKTGKVNSISHSEGGLITQFALNYFPSARPFVENFVALAADFHGTDEGPYACAALSLLGRCTPAIRQQSSGSDFLAALLKRGNKALVPTLSIWTAYDDVIQSEFEPHPTSRLPGAENIVLQDPKAACGPLEIAEHFTMLSSPSAFSLAMARIVPNTKFSKYYCDNYIFGTGLNKDTLAKVAKSVGAIALDLSSFLLEPATSVEPPLKPYVCAAGDATKCS